MSSSKVQSEGSKDSTSLGSEPNVKSGDSADSKVSFTEIEVQVLNVLDDKNDVEKYEFLSQLLTKLEKTTKEQEEKKYSRLKAFLGECYPTREESDKWEFLRYAIRKPAGRTSELIELLVAYAIEKKYPNIFITDKPLKLSSTSLKDVKKDDLVNRMMSFTDDKGTDLFYLTNSNENKYFLHCIQVKFGKTLVGLGKTTSTNPFNTVPIYYKLKSDSKRIKKSLKKVLGDVQIITEFHLIAPGGVREIARRNNYDDFKIWTDIECWNLLKDHLNFLLGKMGPVFSELKERCHDVKEG